MAAAAAGGWLRLGTPRAELVLANTLPTGQTFRWRRDAAGPHESYTGVIGPRLVQLRQLADDVEWRVLARGPGAPADADAAALADYFNLGTSLAALAAGWAARDALYAQRAPALPGCRMLRQPPLECLFSFICSSNNHITRIQGMVERLCCAYGTPLLPVGDANNSYGSGGLAQLTDQQGAASPPATPSPGPPLAPPAAAPGPRRQEQQQQQPAPAAFSAFPTLQQLSAATEEALRADGFGYRARYVVGTVQQLLARPEGGDAWLLSLRQRSYAEAHEALCGLPGVGPKVAACICLFSLDKHQAIPVDTHVWALATRHYARHLASKALTPKLHGAVQDAFVAVFGDHAGWAHNLLFISELASHRPLLAAVSGGGGGGGQPAGAAGQGGKPRRTAPAGAGSAAAAAAAAIEAAAETPAHGGGGSRRGSSTGGAAEGVRRTGRRRRRNSRYASSGSDASDASDSEGQERGGSSKHARCSPACDA